MDEWREWAEGRRAWRDQMAAAAQKIIEARYESAEDPDDYTVQQVGSCCLYETFRSIRSQPT